MIEPGLVSYLSAHPLVTTLVGTRVYPLELPQGVTLPAITYQRISGPRVRSQSGPSGLAHPRIQLNCWARDYAGAVQLADVVRRALDGYRGAMGSTIVQASFLDNDLDGHEPDTGLWRRTLDVILWHEEAV